MNIAINVIIKLYKLTFREIGGRLEIVGPNQLHSDCISFTNVDHSGVDGASWSLVWSEGCPSNTGQKLKYKFIVRSSQNVQINHQFLQQTKNEVQHS